MPFLFLFFEKKNLIHKKQNTFYCETSLYFSGQNIWACVLSYHLQCVEIQMCALIAHNKLKLIAAVPFDKKKKDSGFPTATTESTSIEMQGTLIILLGSWDQKKRRIHIEILKSHMARNIWLVGWDYGQGNPCMSSFNGRRLQSRTL